MELFEYKKFKDINLGDVFFNSLKEDYSEFENWFNRKASANESAYTQTVNNKIEGFLYLKPEDGPITDITPTLTDTKIVKIGTMKINPHGTRLGERFIKKSIDYAIQNDIKAIYVTVFDKHEALINMYIKYGFEEYGIKTSENGTEKVLLKRLDVVKDNFTKNYPLINKTSNAYVLSIIPKFHTKLFPDSKLANENFDIVRDISHTNSIEKIYICRMGGVRNFNPGDLVVIYRTTDIPGNARHRSVVSSLCTVESVKSTTEFKSFEDFKAHCKNYSVFTDAQLRSFYNSEITHYVIKMTYNIAFPKRLTRGHLIDNLDLDENMYWGVFPITNDQLNEILNDAEVNPNYFI